MIDRRLFIGTLAVVASRTALAADTAPTGKVWRVGYLGSAPVATSPESGRIFAAFTQGLRDNGLVEGKNIVLERRATQGHAGRAAALVAELIATGVDVLVIAPVVGARAAKDATTSIPIVMLMGSDPVAGGLVASLSRPGGNITGLTDFNDDLNAKRLELLKLAAPRATRVAFVEPDYTGRFSATQIAALTQEYDLAARALGVTLRRVPLKKVQDFDVACAAIVRERVGALLVDDGAITHLLRKDIADFAIRQRLPAIVSNRDALTGGALMSYGPDLADNWRKAATYVAKILGGAKPADLPVERPTRVELVINAKTAKAIGLTMPQTLLLRADEVIE